MFGQEAVQKPEKKVVEVQGMPIPPVACQGKLPPGKVVKGVRIEPITVKGFQPVKGEPIPPVHGKVKKPSSNVVEGVKIPGAETIVK